MKIITITIGLSVVLLYVLFVVLFSEASCEDPLYSVKVEYLRIRKDENLSEVCQRLNDDLRTSDANSWSISVNPEARMNKAMVSGGGGGGLIGALQGLKICFGCKFRVDYQKKHVFVN